MRKRIYYEKWQENHLEVLNYLTKESRRLIKYSVSGVYAVYAYVNGFKILIYCGESGDTALRFKQHLKRWFGNHQTEYHIGIDEKLFIEGEVKLGFEILKEEKDLFTRLRFEEKTVLEQKPVLQDDFNKTFDKYKYGDNPRADICIVPFNGTRKKAILRKLKELEIA